MTLNFAFYFIVLFTNNFLHVMFNNMKRKKMAKVWTIPLSTNEHTYIDNKMKNVVLATKEKSPVFSSEQYSGILVFVTP